jgi:predicted nucleic acid-binding protein
MPDQIRIFLDANILFSASYRVNSQFLKFWEVPDVIVVTSVYAAEEAKRNCASDAQLQRLDQLLKKTLIVTNAVSGPLPKGISLPPKDQPILAAALSTKADFLITGDKEHFGNYYGRFIVAGKAKTIVLTPAAFLDFYFSSE